MQLLDVNILIYAFRKDHADHPRYKQWLEDLVNSHQPFALSDLVCSGFLRIVTHPKVFAQPDSIQDALQFLQSLRAAPGCIILAPAGRHWGILTHLCIEANAKGNLVADAYHAALAIEHGCDWITTDHDFARFPGLTWHRPF